jgi:hypothetical protein
MMRFQGDRITVDIQHPSYLSGHLRYDEGIIAIYWMCGEHHPRARIGWNCPELMAPVLDDLRRWLVAPRWKSGYSWQRRYGTSSCVELENRGEMVGSWRVIRVGCFPTTMGSLRRVHAPYVLEFLIIVEYRATPDSSVFQFGWTDELEDDDMTIRFEIYHPLADRQLLIGGNEHLIRVRYAR